MQKIHGDSLTEIQLIRGTNQLTFKIQLGGFKFWLQ